MQVKKFEARTMNEALEMVKRELGPDAIILSARDHRRKFGLVGDGSVEITAAVAEQTLQKKRFAESRMNDSAKVRFQASSVRQQRNIVNGFVDSYHNETEASARQASAQVQRAAVNRPATNRRYIDIEDEPGVESEQASLRIRDAAQRAWEAMRDASTSSQQRRAASAEPVRVPSSGASAHASSGAPTIAQTPVRGQVTAAQVQAKIQAVFAEEMAEHVRNTSSAASADAAIAQRDAALVGKSQAEIQALKSELESLKTVLRDFQKVPQNFAGTHPGSEYGLSYDFSAGFEKLTQAGISRELAGEILQTAQNQLPQIKHKSRGLIDGFAAKYILDTTKVTGVSKSRIQCFIGPRGSGKTSSLVKMASHAVVSGHKKVAMITTDNQKVGAVDQMRIFAQILNVPFGVVRKAADWKPLLEQLAGFDLVLCDFPGVSMKNMDEISLLKNLMPPESCDVHLTLSACAKDAELEETCRRFEAAKYSDIIFNHLDEALLHGSIYNLMRKFNRPLHSFGVGPQVPEDFEAATKERVLDLIFRLTKFKRHSQE